MLIMQSQDFIPTVVKLHKTVLVYQAHDNSGAAVSPGAIFVDVLPSLIEALRHTSNEQCYPTGLLWNWGG